jgi:hypothetical protein
MTENKKQHVDTNMEITEENNKEENKINLVGERIHK